MALERTYNIPLRKEVSKVPRYKRAKKAVRAVREFLQRHMKTETVKVGKHLNLKIWENGIKNVPHHVNVNAVKDDKGVVTAEIVGAPVEKKKAEDEKKGEKKKVVKKEEVKETKTEVKKEVPQKTEAAVKKAPVPEKKEVKKEVKVEQKSKEEKKTA